MINDELFQRETAVLVRGQIYPKGGPPWEINMAENDREYIRQAHITIYHASMALENITNPFEIDGLVFRLDHLLRTLVN